MKDTVLAVRITAETKERLKRLADKEGRSLSNYVLHILNTYSQGQSVSADAGKVD